MAKRIAGRQGRVGLRLRRSGVTATGRRAALAWQARCRNDERVLSWWG